MGEPRCDMTDLFVSQCGHCRPPVEEPPPELDCGPWFTAKLDGRCSLGEEQVRPGDRIRSDGEVGYLCRSCGGMFP
jgi:hypothetical protein